MADDVLAQLRAAFQADDAGAVRALLDQNPQFKAGVNEPLGPFDSPAIVLVCSRAMLDVLLDAGADINARSRWWAGGFGLLDFAAPDLADYAIQRGAKLDAHSAARLGLLDALTALVEADPGLVHARGGDGQTPLHFAKNAEIARFLLDHGADIDARDIDHESTPAQYLIRDRQDVVRFLVSRGCTTDILMAAALGDLELIRRCLATNPDSIRTRVGSEWFPMVNPRAGGTIYQWTLGAHTSPHQVACEFGHPDACKLLMDHSPDEIRLAAACWIGDDALIARLLAAEPALADRLDAADRRLLAHAARNNDLPAVRRLLAAGLPIDATGQHNATPLHWAAFHGNAEMARILLARKPPLEVRDADHSGTPMDWALHGSEHGWYCKTGDYAATVEALIDAGAVIPATARGSQAVRDVLNRHRE